MWQQSILVATVSGNARRRIRKAHEVVDLANVSDLRLLLANILGALLLAYLG